MKNLTSQDKQILLQSYLFKGISLQELNHVLPCIGSELNTYSKDEYIFRYEDYTSKFGLVLTGSVNILRYDFWGNRHIVTAALPGETFGESYAAMPQTALSVSVQASVDTKILFFTFTKVMHQCAISCSYHAQLIDNLIHLMAYHNISLQLKLTHITQRSIRDKLLSYLSAQSLLHHSPYFDIPFNRQELADYLNIDRSAMSNEMSKMKKEGLLDYKKNHFKLISSQED
ncbi:MAG: Crp/Fnr family transcriptional regulator [Clostridiales bacterium]|nr:Crp/Fnr family transcriptional regulator [Clostridiales bacterium]